MRYLALILCLVSPLAHAQTATEIAVAKQVLGPLQAKSFKANREFCGILGVDDAGRVVASEPRKGKMDSCTPRDPRAAVEFIASFHTHGSFDFEADSEVPSVDDMLADMSEGLDGWVATPGGRLWFIDGQAGVTRQICGLGCLPQDPDFEPGYMGHIPERFTLDQLERFFEE